MKKAHDYTPRALVRHTFLNFSGQVIPLLVGILSTPFIIQGLGVQRFGILSLAWIVIGYFSLFDLGLGRATTKFVAEILGQDEVERLPSLFWSALLFNAGIGVVGGLIITTATPFLVNRLFNIPADLIVETTKTFFILSLSVPLVVITTALRGVLEGGQRFELVNLVKIPLSCLSFLIPAVGASFGLDLPEIVAVLLAARFMAAAAYLILCFHAFPSLKRRISIDRKQMLPLLTFGSWITVSNLISPLMVYLDRFFIGSFLSMDEVAFYTAPYDSITRLWLVPMSLVITLFPVFSSLGKTRKDELGDIYAQASKYLLLILGPMILVIILFAPDILQLWLGAEFAERSGHVLQILALGVFINSMAAIAFSIIQGIGRPDLTAKFHLIELPLYLVLVWVLMCKYGITGVALAWTIRVILDAALVFWAAQRLIPSARSAFMRTGFPRAILAFLALTAAGIGVIVFVQDLLIRILILSGFTAIFGAAAWRYLLTPSERQMLGSIMSLKKAE